MLWLDPFLKSVTIEHSGSSLQPRGVVNFTGAGVDVADDPATESTTVTISAAAPNAQVSAKAAATGNITKSGTQTIDGVALGVGDVVLLTGQTVGSEDGLWVVAAGAWARTTDTIASGLIVFVQLGAGNKGTWYLVTAAPIVVNSTALSFVRVDQTMNVRLFGAKGNGTTNDQAAFAAGLAALSAIGGGTLYCPTGTYLLGSKITIPSGVVVKGDGKLATVLKATAGPSAPWTNVAGEGMIELRGVQNAGLVDLTVHGNGSLRTPGSGGDPMGDTIDVLVVLAATINCRLERCRITEGGYATSTGGTPSGPNVLLVAKDTANDLGGQFGTVAAQDCRGNTIRGCTFDDNSGATRVAKGLGIITDFGMIAPLAHDYSFNLSRRQTTINGAVAINDTNLTVADSHGFAIGDSVRVERAADNTMFDHGNVTAIPDATHVTIDTPVTRTYAASDKFGTSRDAVSAYGPGGTQAASFRGRAVDLAGDGRGRLGVATTVRASMSNPASVVKATSALNVALGDTARVSRIADNTLFDEGVVTAIAASGDITIGTPTTRTYGQTTTIAAGSNGVALPTATIHAASTAGFGASGQIFVTTGAGVQLVTYTGLSGNDFTGCTGGTGTMSTGGAIVQADVVRVTAFSAASGFNGGDYFARHAEANVIEDNDFTGVFNLYAVGIQGGGACRNVVQRNRFKSIRALGAVLVDKGAYANTVVDNFVIDHQRDTVFLSSSPIATFVDRALAGYYGFDNYFERNRVVAFVGTLQYDAPFAVGENAIRDVFRKNVIDGATVSGNVGMGFMVGQGNVDVVIAENTVRGTNYGIFSNLGGAPLVPTMGGEFIGNALDVTHQAILLSSTASGLAAGGSWAGSVKIHQNRVTGTTDVAGGQIAIDNTIAMLLAHDNHIERFGTPGGGHVGMSIATPNGVVHGNVGKNQPTGFAFSGFSGVRGHNRDSTTTAQDLDAEYAAYAAATDINAAQAIVKRDGAGSFSAQNITGVGQVSSPFIIATGQFKPTWKIDSDGATITFNFNQGNSHSVTLGGNRTLAVSNLSQGAEYVIILIQDAGTPRTVTWPAGTKWVGGTAPTLSNGNGKIDMFRFWNDGTNLYELSRALDVR